jgi:glycosyltransferase involved in cell wall biosynthesis
MVANSPDTMSPRIGIVIATYNYGRFLTAALDSVLAQTLASWEAVIVDDGSTDETVDVVRPYLSDPRIRYHRTEHVGQPQAKNIGIQLTSAPLVAFLDADDLWLPEKLERQIALFDHDPELGVAYSARSWMDENGHALDRPKPTLHRGYVLPQMFKDNFVCFSSAMVRRAIFTEVGMFNEQIPLAIDYDLWLRIAVQHRFDYVNEPLVAYRTGHANLSRRAEERLLVALEIMRRFLNHPGQRRALDPGVVRRAYAETYAHVGQCRLAVSRRSALPWALRAVVKDPGCGVAWKLWAKACLPRAPLRTLYRWFCGKQDSTPLHTTTSAESHASPALERRPL